MIEGFGRNTFMGSADVLIHLQGNGGPFDSDALPTSIDIGDFPDAYFVFGTFDPTTSGGDRGVIGVITSVTIIPEPGTLSLLVLGGLLITRGRTSFVRKRLRKGCSISCKTLVLLIVLGFTGAFTASADSTEGPFVSIQVNVDSNGNNTVGDAGNEPSIAIDPMDPNKMVIAFRHFSIIVGDNARSDAGIAYSTDGGISWTMDVLDPQPLNPSGERDSFGVGCCHAPSQRARALDRMPTNRRIGNRNRSWSGQVA